MNVKLLVFFNLNMCQKEFTFEGPTIFFSHLNIEINIDVMHDTNMRIVDRDVIHVVMYIDAVCNLFKVCFKLIE